MVTLDVNGKMASVSAGFGPLPITPSPRNAEACSSGATSERSGRRAVGPATAAVPSAPWLRVPGHRGRAILEKRGAPVTGERNLRTQFHDRKAARMLSDRLRLIFDWYRGMVDESTGRLLYMYDPENGVTIGDGEPIRDIASIWDVEVVSEYLGCDDLKPLIWRSLDYFTRLIVERGEYAVVAPRGEQSSIAHSAFMALALARSEFSDKIHRLVPLVDGILRQQRKDGSYKIFFDAEPDSGEELYPAEAMLALLEAHRLTEDARYLDSVERSFVHYKRAYYDRGRVQPDFLVFFANWQSQAGRLLLETTTKPKVKDLVCAFLFELNDFVIESGFYDRVARQPEAQACVEVACGLEGLADAYAVAASSKDRRTADYRRCILTALGFLMRAQRTTGCTDRERGGFGHSIAVREQRIDVTGHVASGFIKSVENGIDVPAT